MTDAIREFAETLFGLYPDFIPTQALYIDLEGRQSGSEDILSFYRPCLAWVSEVLMDDTLGDIWDRPEGNGSAPSMLVV